MGSLVTELLTIHEGHYVVRALVQVTGTTLATGMAAAPTIEIAEDQARIRALQGLGLQADAVLPHRPPQAQLSAYGLQVHWTGQQGEMPDLSALRFGGPQPAIAPTPQTQASLPIPMRSETTQEGTPQTPPIAPQSITSQPVTPQAAPSAPVAHSHPVASPPTLHHPYAGLSPEPMTAPMSAPMVEPQESMEPQGSMTIDASLPQPQQTAVPESTPTPPPPADDPFTHWEETNGFEPELEDDLQPPFYDEPDTEADGAAPQIIPPATLPAPIAEPNIIVDRSDEIAQIDVEMRRLGWTKAQGRKYLLDTYNKRSRQQLNDQELLEFLEYLASQPSPHESPF